MILDMDTEAYKACVRRCKENKVILPTLDQLAHPETIPDSIKEGMVIVK